MMLNLKSDSIYRRPASIVEGLTQIGGFLAILKFSMMLKMIHRSQFKNNLKREFQTSSMNPQEKKSQVVVQYDI
jgi:mannose/fructose/N-acetylgalactosamine-specific phosphotransferase system component IIC